MFIAAYGKKSRQYVILNFSLNANKVDSPVDPS